MKQETERDWNRFTRARGEGSRSEESDKTHMIASCSCNNDKDDINIAEDNEYVYY